MHVELRVGDLYPVLLKCIPDQETDVAFGTLDAKHVFAVKQQLEDHSVLCKLGHAHRGWIQVVAGDHMGMLCGTFQQDLAHVFHVGVVRDIGPDDKARHASIVTPVDHIALGEVVIWNNHDHIVTVAQDRGAQVDLFDYTYRLVHLQDIALLDGAVEEQDDAGYEVGKDALEPKSEPDKQRRRAGQ